VSPWPLVPTGRFMSLRTADVSVTANEEYHFAGVYCFGNGAFVGQKKLGMDFAYKRLTRLHAGDFVYPKLMAWEGAFAVVPPECDGLFVSTEFPVFEIDQSQALPAYLDYYFRRPSIWPELSGGSTGTNVRRRRLHPTVFLGHQLPLPPLAEQRRLVERIDAVAAKIAEADARTAEVEREARSLLRSAYHRIADDAPRQRLGDVAPLVRRPATVDLFSEYPQVSVRSFGKGTFQNPPLRGSEITWEKPHLVKAGDILISNIKAWEGAIAVAGPQDDGRYGSHRYLTYVPVAGVATARFLCFHLLTPEGLAHVGEASPGSADRNRTLNSKALLEVSVPVPAFSQQVWFGQLCEKVVEVHRLQSETTAGRERLMPVVLDLAFRDEL
jgi:type I restriction enzyme S subunit